MCVCFAPFRFFFLFPSVLVSSLLWCFYVNMTPTPLAVLFAFFFLFFYNLSRSILPDYIVLLLLSVSFSFILSSAIAVYPSLCVPRLLPPFAHLSVSSQCMCACPLICVQIREVVVASLNDCAEIRLLYTPFCPPLFPFPLPSSPFPSPSSCVRFLLTSASALSRLSTGKVTS